jgi:hypothetical protein
MFGLETLDVLIGLVTVYLVFGVACTAIVEAVATVLNMRSNNLQAALQEFLAGDLTQAASFVTAFHAHPLVQALSKGKDGRPSYIPSAIVAQVVEALVTTNSAAPSLAAAVDALPGTPDTNRIKGLLDALVKQVGGDAAAFCTAVETHFNATMDRASGWFKRRAQTITLIASLLLVMGSNLDTVDLANSLASSPTARMKMVEIAEQNMQKAEGAEKEATGGALEEARKRSKEAEKTLTEAVSVMQSAGLQFGWKRGPQTVGEFFAKVAGLLVSIFAVSLGAPFWFDVLQRFMQVRAAGAAPSRRAEKKK